MPDQKVLDLLQEKYDQSFVIQESRFSGETGKYYITAAPENDEELSFAVEYNPTDEEMVAYYEEYLWRRQARDYFMDAMKDKDVQMALAVDVTPKESPDGKDIPSFEEMISDHPEDLSLSFHIHLFGDLKKSNSDDYLDPIADVIADLIDKDIESGALLLNAYEEESLDGKSPDDFSFGFANPSMEDFEETHKKYWSGKILAKFNPESKKPSGKDLFELYTEKKFSFKFNKL